MRERVKLGVGPAISESVSSVFKEMRRHFRVSVTAAAGRAGNYGPAKGRGRSFRLAAAPRPRHAGRPQGDSAVRRGRCVGKVGLALVPASPFPSPFRAFSTACGAIFDSGRERLASRRLWGDAAPGRVAEPVAGESRGARPPTGPERSCPSPFLAFSRACRDFSGRDIRPDGSRMVGQLRAGRFLQVPASLLRSPDDVIANPCKASSDAHICGRFRPQDAIIAPIPADVHVLFFVRLVIVNGAVDDTMT